MPISPVKVDELIMANWRSVNTEDTFYIHKELFSKGVVYFFDPSGYTSDEIKADVLRIGKTRSLQFFQSHPKETRQLTQKKVTEVNADQIQCWIKNDHMLQHDQSGDLSSKKPKQTKFSPPISRRLALADDVTYKLVSDWIEATNSGRDKKLLKYLLKNRSQGVLQDVVTDQKSAPELKLDVGLRRISDDYHHTNEVYNPKVVRDDKNTVSAALYINARRLGSQGSQDKFDVFHAETCLFGAQLSCKTNKGSTRHFTKHNVEFFPGEQITVITSLASENAYERMQFEELKVMATMMAAHAEVGLNDRPSAKVLHHLPWLDYIISGVLLWDRGRMTYDALWSLCDIIIAKKITHEKAIQAIYVSVGLTCEFVTPFSNLLDPKKSITPESILAQLGVDPGRDLVGDRDGSPERLNTDVAGLLQNFSMMFKQAGGFADVRSSPAYLGLVAAQEQLKTQLESTIKTRDQEFVTKFLNLLKTQDYNKKQKEYWSSMADLYEKAGYSIATLENLFDIGNAMVVGLAGVEGKRVCSFVSTQARRIQVIYEKLFNCTGEGLFLPEITCWTSVPLFFAKSVTTEGPTFYFEYAGFAEVIAALIDRDIVASLVSNIAAFEQGKAGESVDRFLNPQLSSVELIHRKSHALPESDLAIRDRPTTAPLPKRPSCIQQAGYFANIEIPVGTVPNIRLSARSAFRPASVSS